MADRRYNSLKKRALAAFRGRAWLNPPAWSVLAGFRPSRSAWGYLLRLHRFGLLQRRRDTRGLLVYRLNEKGERRLRWLERNR
jgi:hypothetical protein